MSDPTQAQVDTLDPEMAWRAAVLINALRDEGYPAGIVTLGGRRTPAQQAPLVAEGYSLTLRSKHILGRAFDLDILGVNRDAVPLWFWNSVGPWAERWLGLKWGGRWTSPRDLAHFEL